MNKITASRTDFKALNSLTHSLIFVVLLSLIRNYATHADRALKCRDMSGKGFILWITYILVLTTQEPGPPPRQHIVNSQYSLTQACKT